MHTPFCQPRAMRGLVSGGGLPAMAALVLALGACAGSEDAAGPPVIDIPTASTTTSSTTLPELEPLRGLELELVAGGLSVGGS